MIIAKAGYILDGYFDQIENQPFIDCLQHLSTFKCDFESKRITQLSILKNLIKRGVPTRPSDELVELVCEKYDEVSRVRDSFKFSLDDTKHPKQKHWLKSIYNYDNRNASRIDVQHLFDSESEKSFYRYLTNLCEPLKHLLQQQKPIREIINIDEVKGFDLDDLAHSDQKVDFAIEFYKPIEFKGQKIKGVVFEVDGPHHNEWGQRQLDSKRDELIEKSGWLRPFRISVDYFKNWHSHQNHQLIIELLDNEYFKTFSAVDNINLESNGINKILGPIHIARIQLVLLEILEALDADNPELNLLFVQRDIGDIDLAIIDLQCQIRHLNRLLAEPIPIPKINVKIVSSMQPNGTFQEADGIKFEWYSFAEQLPISSFDFVVDTSIFMNENYGVQKPINVLGRYITLRSSNKLSVERKLIVNPEKPDFKPILEYDENEDPIYDLDVVQGLIFFLRSIFRLNTFRIGQLEIINRALQHKPVIGLLPTGGGKSLTYQIAALLNPSMTLVIDPLKSLMKDQVDGLKAHLIDSCLYINSTLDTEARLKAEESFVNMTSQFLFISPERLQIEEFREKLGELYENGGCFGYCIIDEAHCVSEWGHDFRTSYLHLGRNALEFCRGYENESITLFGLTATASYDVLADIQRELTPPNEVQAFDEGTIIQTESLKRVELQYEIIPVNYTVTAERPNEFNVKTAIAEAKHSAISSLLDTMRNKFEHYQSDVNLCLDESEQKRVEFNKVKKDFAEENEFFENGENAGIIFSPHASGIEGVTSNNNKYKSLYSLVKEKRFLKAGYFIGGGGLNKAHDEKMVSNQDAFKKNETDLLVATKAFGMGIDKDNVRFTIHYNYPPSIESLVQETGRAGRDRKLAICFILFANEPFSLNGKSYDHEAAINFDFHNRSFKGRTKEMAMVDEILNNIHYPKRLSELNAFLSEETNGEFKLNFGKTGSNLFINREFGERFGYIRIAPTVQLIESNSIDKEKSQFVYSKFNEFLRFHDVDVGIEDFLKSSFSEEGLHSRLEKIDFNEEFELGIGFSNNTEDRNNLITKWLNAVLLKGFTPKDVELAYDWSKDFKEFASNLEREASKRERQNSGTWYDFSVDQAATKLDHTRGDNPGTSLGNFERFYNGYRLKDDTDKLIYRLSLIGILKDYTVDYNTKSYKLTVQKLRDEEYYANVKNYLLKYYSQKVVDLKLKKLEEYNYDSNIKNYLAFLIDFIYQEVAEKRKLAIRETKEACTIGLEKKNVEFKEYIHLYFNSKYARRSYTYTHPEGEELVNASLGELTDNGKTSSIDLIWDFIGIVRNDPNGAEIDNFKHLRGACQRLLLANPENYTLSILSAYALFFLEYRNTRLLLEAEEKLRVGFANMASIEGLFDDEERLRSLFNQFVTHILDQRPELINSYQFSFDNIMIDLLLMPLQMASRKMNLITTNS